MGDIVMAEKELGAIIEEYFTPKAPEKNGSENREKDRAPQPGAPIVTSEQTGEVPLLVMRDIFDSEDTIENNNKLRDLYIWAVEERGVDDMDKMRVMFSNIYTSIKDSYGVTKLDSIHGWLKLMKSVGRLWLRQVTENPPVDGNQPPNPIS